MSTDATPPAMRLATLASAFFLAAPVAAQSSGGAAPDTLYAALDLREGIEAGWLDPATETVGLRGGTAPLSWDVTRPAEDADGDGVYTVAVPFLVSADSLTVELKVKVDGAANPNDGWQLGSNHAVTVHRGRPAQLDLAWGDRPPEELGVVTGRVDTIEDVEGAGLAARNVYVYVPPGYAESDRHYPVLYLHDGAGMFGTEPGGEWGMDEAAEALIEAGEIEPLLIVAVANTDARTDEYTPTARAWERTLTRTAPPTSDGPLGALTGTYDAGGDSLVVAVRDGGLVMNPPDMDTWLPITADASGAYPIMGTDITLTFAEATDGAAPHIVATRPAAGGLGDRYGQLLTDVVKPLIDRRYRTRPDAASTGVGGSSLGGLISMHLGLTRPDVFGRLLVASPSVWWDDRWILGAVARATPPPGQRVWVDIGTGEGGSMVPDARALHAALLERGWDPALVRYVEAEGAGHESRAWAVRAPDMLRFLFPAE